MVRDRDHSKTRNLEGVRRPLYVAGKMGDPLADLNPFDVTLAPRLTGRRGSTTIFRAILENGTGEDGGEVEIEITGSAKSAYGLRASLLEFEVWINSTLGPEYRLDATLAMGRRGPFMVVRGVDGRPRVIDPETRARLDLAA